jgi:hypothetical protein
LFILLSRSFQSRPNLSDAAGVKGRDSGMGQGERKLATGAKALANYREAISKPALICPLNTDYKK